MPASCWAVSIGSDSEVYRILRHDGKAGTSVKGSQALVFTRERVALLVAPLLQAGMSHQTSLVTQKPNKII